MAAFRSNPLPSRRQQRQRAAFRSRAIRRAAAILPILCVGGLLAYFVESPHFAIDRVMLDTGEHIDEGEIRALIYAQMDERRFGLMPQKNILFFDPSAAAKRIRESYALENLRISRKFPNTLDIQLSGFPQRIIWKTGDVRYDVDGRGVVIKIHRSGDPSDQGLSGGSAIGLDADGSESEGAQAQSSARDALPLVIDPSNQPIELGKPVLTQSAVDFIVPLMPELAAIGVTATHLEMAPLASDITVRTSEGWVLAMTPLDDRAEQIFYLKTLLDQKIGSDRARLAKIDVRFSNHLYYTFR